MIICLHLAAITISVCRAGRSLTGLAAARKRLNFAQEESDYFADFFFSRAASASRSVFLRRAARFLTLSLPWLFPIMLNSRHTFSGSKLFLSDIGFSVPAGQG